MNDHPASVDSLDWRDGGLGTRVRVALWLHTCVEPTESRIFTRQQLLGAFAGVGNVERRMRDLRQAGWVISTPRDSADLGPDEFRLAAVGEAVWEPGKRGAGQRLTSAQVRREVLQRDGFRCTCCGIGSGDCYDDAPSVRARLVLVPVPSTARPVGLDAFITECGRCAAGGRPRLPEPGDVADQIVALPDAERLRLLAWMAADRRVLGEVEHVWIAYRQLPAQERDLVRQRLAEELGAP